MAVCGDAAVALSQGRLCGTLAMRFRIRSVSVRPGNVVRIHIDDEDAVAFKDAEDCLDVRPTVAKLFLLFRTPFGENLLREPWRLVEKGAAEVENVRPGYDGHFNDQQVVVV